MKTFEQRCAAAAARAVGKEYSVRTQRATASQSGIVVSGRVERVELAGTIRGNAAFRVWLEARPESFIVTRLPR